MTRGTTPTYKITFEQDIDFSTVDAFYFTLKQSSTAKVTRKISGDSPSIDAENRTIEWTLTQEETLKFKEGGAELQVRGKFKDDVAFATKVYRVPVNRILYDEVI